MNERILTCIICPKGCNIAVNFDENGISKIEGNTCPRGREYAVNECTNPLRTVTTTVRCDNGEVAAVKTDRPIPKKKIFDCMNVINHCIAHLPVSIGDVIIEDVYGSNIVASENKSL